MPSSHEEEDQFTSDHPYLGSENCKNCKTSFLWYYLLPYRSGENLLVLKVIVQQFWDVQWFAKNS